MVCATHTCLPYPRIGQERPPRVRAPHIAIEPKTTTVITRGAVGVPAARSRPLPPRAPPCRQYCPWRRGTPSTTATAAICEGEGGGAAAGEELLHAVRGGEPPPPQVLSPPCVKEEKEEAYSSRGGAAAHNLWRPPRPRPTWRNRICGNVTQDIP